MISKTPQSKRGGAKGATDQTQGRPARELQKDIAVYRLMAVATLTATRLMGGAFQFPFKFG